MFLWDLHLSQEPWITLRFESSPTSSGQFCRVVWCNLVIKNQLCFIMQSAVLECIEQYFEINLRMLDDVSQGNLDVPVLSGGLFISYKFSKNIFQQFFTPACLLFTFVWKHSLPFLLALACSITQDTHLYFISGLLQLWFYFHSFVNDSAQ